MSTPTTERQFPFSENGARIRSARRRTGLSQEKFAPAVGTTRRHMIRLENGEHLPSRELRDRIAEATGQPSGSIQSADDEDEDSLPPHRSLSDDLRRLAQVAELIERSPDVLDAVFGHEQVHA